MGQSCSQVYDVGGCQEEAMCCRPLNGKREAMETTCGICMEATREPDTAEIPGCSGHGFCSNCVREFVASALQDRSRFPLSCPEPSCSAELGPSVASAVGLSGDKLVKFHRFHEESLMKNMVYCSSPFCGVAMNINREELLERGARVYVCRQCDVPNCLQCLAWHSGLSCDEYMRMADGGAQDNILEQVSLAMQWKKCRCGARIELREGCNHVSIEGSPCS